MKLQKKKFNSNHLLAIFIVVCGLLAGISVFAGGVLTPVKNIFFTVLSPMQEGINSVGNAVFSWNENAKSKKTLRAENERLQEKIDVLKMQNRVLQQNQVELERLQDLLKLKQKYKKYHTVGARVISKGSGNWFDIFLINRGSKDGIKKDMNVIAGNGLVGIVYDVSSHTAKVRTIINDTSMVSAMFLKTNDACIVNGSLDTMEDGYLEVVYISKDAKVKNGDELVTSYVSSKFNEGITIGKVSDLKLDSTKLTKTAKVTPVVDFKHLKEGEDMKIKRILFYVISVLVCFLLQTSVFNFLKLAGVMPNILLILTVTIAFIRGRKAGIVIGFVCGLLIDIFSGNVLGQNAFVYLMFGYVNGWFHTYFYEDDILLPIGLLTANSLAYSFVIFFFFFAMRGRLQFFSYLFKVMIPEAVYTGIVALLIYKILLEVDIRIRDGEKRSMF